MAAGDITEGARTVLANVVRLHSLANGAAAAFGKIDNGAAAGAIAQSIHLMVPINSLATGGDYKLYLVESQDGLEWTDNIDPATAGDVAAKIADARLLAAVDTTYDGTNRTEAEFHLTLNMLELAQFVGLVLDNNSGQAIPASGADGDSQSKKVS